MSIYISKALASVTPSATMAVTQQARELKAAGVDIIALGAGEPDFDTPVYIRSRAKEAIDRGFTRYTNVDGIPELKAAICEKFKRDNQLDYTPDEINVSPGGKPVLYNALMASLNSGDEVIIPTPCWVSYPEMVKLAHAVPVMVKCDAQSHYKLTPSALRSALTPRSRWLILNSPSNPTGAAYSADELSELAHVVREYPGLLVLTDDIYEHLVYDNFQFATFAQIAPDLKERVLTMNGVSKAYAMTGWRIGYAGGPKWLIRAMSKIMTQSTSNPSSISQWAALAALNGPHDFLDEWRSKYAARRDMIVTSLTACKGLSCQSPTGAFYAFADCRDYLGMSTSQGKRLATDIDFCSALLSEGHVAVVPGTAFHAPGHFRLSYACDMKSLKQAAQRIAMFCASLS